MASDRPITLKDVTIPNPTPVIAIPIYRSNVTPFAWMPLEQQKIVEND
jgi:hypothetical protein